MPLKPRLRWPPVPLLVMALAGCAVAQGGPDRAGDPRAAGAATSAAQPRAMAAVRRSEPAPVPRITEERMWRFGPNPARRVYDWPDRYSGAPAGGPFRPGF